MISPISLTYIKEAMKYYKRRNTIQEIKVKRERERERGEGSWHKVHKYDVNEPILGIRDPASISELHNVHLDCQSKQKFKLPFVLIGTLTLEIHKTISNKKFIIPSGFFF